MSAYAVYFYFNKQNQLLYIGMSRVLSRRIYSHELYSPWITQAHQIRIIWHKTRAEAQVAEKRAILRYNPPCNRTANEIKAWTSSIIRKNRARRDAPRKM
jgi:excinuclease UvrABC nuclease subunit